MPCKLQGKETYERINFLYQASVLMSGKNNILGAYYGQLSRNIAKKAVLHVAPDIKRNLCKRCGLAIKPAITTDITLSTTNATKERRRRRRKGKKIENMDENAEILLQCRQCDYQRTFRINANYSFWLDNPGSITQNSECIDIDPVENGGSEIKH